MASKQERRLKGIGVIKCKACQEKRHTECANNLARHVPICDCTHERRA